MPSRRELADAIYALRMDGVQRARSGHPGTPMGMADIAEVLWNDFLRHNESFLPAAITTRLALKAAVPGLWLRFVGPQERILGLSAFSESAPGPDVYRHVGLATDNGVEAVKGLL